MDKFTFAGLLNYVPVYPKIVLHLSGITKKYKGNLLITKETRNNLENDEISKIFLKFLTSYTTKFNWAYNDRFENEETGQLGFLYLLYLIKKYGDTYREVKFYNKLYYTAFPTLKISKEKMQGILLNDNEWLVALRFFERFAMWFGFIEIQYRDKKSPLSGIVRIKKTELLDQLLAYNTNR